jgi:hypothetical protein
MGDRRLWIAVGVPLAILAVAGGLVLFVWTLTDEFPRRMIRNALPLILGGALFIAYVLVALSDGRGLLVRISQAILAGLVIVVLAPGLFLLSHEAQESARRMEGFPGAGAGPVSSEREQSGIRWTGQAVGAWIALLAVSELLRLILRRQAGAEVLAPVALFLAGVILIDPNGWTAFAFAMVVLGIAGMAVWRPGSNQAPQARPGAGGS